MGLHCLCINIILFNCKYEIYKFKNIKLVIMFFFFKVAIPMSWLNSSAIKYLYHVARYKFSIISMIRKIIMKKKNYIFSHNISFFVIQRSCRRRKRRIDKESWIGYSSRVICPSFDLYVVSFFLDKVCWGSMILNGCKIFPTRNIIKYPYDI